MKKHKKLLRLSVETIRLLTTSDLREAAGGSAVSPSIIGSACWGHCPTFGVGTECGVHTANC